MTIYDRNGTEVLSVTVDDSSYRNRAIMGDDELTLYYSLAEHVELPVGSWCEYENVRYTLMRPEAFKMKHSRRYEYTVTMESDIGKAKIWKFRNTVDGRLKFSLTAQPWEHLKMFCDNMNARDEDGEVWTYTGYPNKPEESVCVEGVETLINYDHAYCWDALGQMADTFNTEFEIGLMKKNDGKLYKYVFLRKAEYNKDNPLGMAYGKGNGFRADVGRSNYGDNPPVEVLYVQGGSDNVDRSKYGNGELLLPKTTETEAKTLKYDGEHFEGEEGFDEENAREYVTDDMGYYIRRLDKAIESHAEESLDCSAIYPKRVGEISAVEETDAEKNYWDFWDDSIPDDLNYEDYLIAGETMTVIFQSGMLAGREFEVKYTHEAKRGYPARHFEIVPQEIDGEMMPNETFKPAVGGTYAVFNCYLPKEYIADDVNKTGAEWEMFKEAVRYMYENEEAQFTFTGEVDPIWFRDTRLAKDLYFVLGGYVLFSDAYFEGKVRITGIKDYINQPYKLELTLSNSMVGASFSTAMVQLQSESVAVEESYRNSVDYTKRRWRDTQETMEMLEAAFTNFSESISPVTVQTMQLLVGDESLQFQFVRGEKDMTRVDDTVRWDNASKVLSVGGGTEYSYLEHMTVGITDISSSHDHRVWKLAPYLKILDDGEKSYYLYAKCEKGEGDVTEVMAGEFVESETPIGMEEEEGYYHFLAGILNSEYEEERSFVTLYGYTEVLPGRITTDRVVSGDSDSYFDMVNNAMKLGDALDFNSKGDGCLRLKGTIVQSQGGDAEEYIGCFRGEWQEGVTYFRGDEVTYAVEGVTSTFRYINPTSSAGVVPTTTAYWEVVASGGSNGNYTELRYAVNGSTTEAPDVIEKTSLEPKDGDGNEWKTTYPDVPSGSYLWQISAVKTGDGSALVTEWSDAVRITPGDGSSPVLVYRGEYDSSKEYYGNSNRRDAVRYNDTYYVARTDAGTFSSIEPTDTSKWNQFGASFESVATNLLLADGASIGDWYISDGKIVSTLQDSGNKITLDAGKDKGVPKITVRSRDEKGNVVGHVTIDGEEAAIDTTTDSTRENGASMSRKGFYTNRAYQECEGGTSGRTRMAGLCVNATGNVDMDDSELGNFLAGIYARVTNEGSAHSFGAYIERLYTRGLVLGVTVVDEASVELTVRDTLVVGASDTSRAVYLPANAVAGQTVIIRQMVVNGSLSVRPAAGSDDKLWTSSVEEDNIYTVRVGRGVIASAVRTKTEGVEYISWLLMSLPLAD